MRFVCQSVGEVITLAERDYFDIVLALGVLHHLDDDEALTLFQIARDAMKPGGRLVTIDGVWTDDQSHIAKYLLSAGSWPLCAHLKPATGNGRESIFKY